MPSIKDSFLNDGAVSPRTRGEYVYNDSGGTLAAGDLVYFSGWHQPSLPERPCRKVKKADANGTDAPAQAVVRNSIVSGSIGRVYATYRLTDQNTNSASAAGDPVYLSNTAGGWTLTDPSLSGTSRKQIVGYVAVKNATTGVVEFNLAEPQARGAAPVADAFDLDVRNESGGALAAGDLVYVSGWSESQTRWLVTKADADAAANARRATYVCTAAISNNANGTVSKSYRHTGLDTSTAGAAGDPVYLNTAAGGYTFTAPTGASARVQVVGFVAVKDAAAGAIEFNLGALDGAQKIGNADLEPGVLSADATGRALMASAFFGDVATVDAKFGTDVIGEDHLAPNEIHGRLVANGAGIAAGAIPATAFAIPMVLPLVIADAASGNNDFTGLPFKCRVIDAWVQATAAGDPANTYTVQTSGGAAVTDAMTPAGGDNDVARAGEIVDATSDFAAAATIRVAHVRNAASSAAIVYVMIIRIA